MNQGNCVALSGVHVTLAGTEVLNDVDLTLSQGVTALLGPNGAGKTTLLRVLATEIRPDSGVVLRAGRSLRGRDALRDHRRRTGVLDQDVTVSPWLRVRDHVRYFGRLAGLPSGAARDAADRALDHVGLADRAGSPSSGLSGGMRRRLGLAAALVHDPDLLVLDEPTVGLDPLQRNAIREVIAVASRGRAVVLSTHLLDDVDAIADRVVVLDGGRVRFDGRPEQLRAQGGGDLGRGLLAVLGPAVPA